MPTNLHFTQKFAESIVAVLGCHDRVIFKGYLPFGRDDHLNRWVDHVLKLRRKDFLPWIEQQSQALVDHAKQQAEQAGAPYQHLQGFHRKEDNAFTQLDNPAQAQRLAERFPKLPWVKRLQRWARQVNPLLGKAWLGKADYYWVIDQAEYSTDVLFSSQAKLAELYPRLLEHALLRFAAQDILRFLGRRLHPRFDGEVLSDCKTDRLPGARIKHRVKNNWLKMYDKFGQILRIETVINRRASSKSVVAASARVTGGCSGVP